MKYNFSAALSGKLDKVKGTIRDVSIITEGPALGHGVEIDTRTLSGIFDLTKGQVVKAYWKHSGPFDSDRLGEEVGLFSAFHIAGNQLKSHFQVLEAFRKTYPERWEYLTELVEKAPKEFGVSIHFEGDAVWALDDGSEVPADTARPANALGEMPRVRVHKLLSADFVGSPAANAGGMFQQGKITELLDSKQKLTGELSALAASIAAAGESLKTKEAALADVTGKFEVASKTLETERAAFATKETEFSALKLALETKVSELTGQLSTLTADVEARTKAAELREKEFNAQLEAMNKTLISFGAVPRNIYSEVIDHAATFAGIKDPADKTRYWNKHKAEILASYG